MAPGISTADMDCDNSNVTPPPSFFPFEHLKILLDSNFGWFWNNWDMIQDNISFAAVVLKDKKSSDDEIKDDKMVSMFLDSLQSVLATRNSPLEAFFLNFSIPTFLRKMQLTN